MKTILCLAALLFVAAHLFVGPLLWKAGLGEVLRDVRQQVDDETVRNAVSESVRQTMFAAADRSGIAMGAINVTVIAMVLWAWRVGCTTARERRV